MNTLLRPFQLAAIALLIVLVVHSTAHAADNDSIQSHPANVNGVTLHYLQAGQGGESPVVLLHGYAETSHMWRPLMPQLADRHVVIAPDLRGAGSSSKPDGGYDKKTLAQDIHALVKSLGYPKVKIVGHDDSTGLDELERMTRVVSSAEDSKALNRRKGPMVIVSASGMVTGRRVLHHLIAFAPDPNNAIILCGFQAGGTRGAAIAAGAKTVRIYGQDVPIRAEVVQLSAASAHADAGEILDWLRLSPRQPRGVFVTQGKPDAANALRVRIQRELGWTVHVPEYLEHADLV